MSKVAITGNASGTGTLTIAAPNTSTDRTLTLPDNTGTILTNATTTGFPAGSVLQVVGATYSTQVLTSAGPVDTGLTASITPTSATSKILVFLFQKTYISGGGADSSCNINLVRGSTNIVSDTAHSIYIFHPTSGSEIIVNHPIIYLDSPATTSSVTYKTTVSAGSGGSVAINWNNNISTITLMEIAA